MLKLLPSPPAPLNSAPPPASVGLPAACRPATGPSHPSREQPRCLEWREEPTLDAGAPLVEAVQQQLRSSGHDPLRDVEIEIHEGIVVLWGRVPSYYLKQLAQSLTQRIPGVRRVANGLEVVCSRGGP